MMDEAKIFLVDDDAAIRDSLCLLLSAAGYQARAFGSAQALFETLRAEHPGCLILDLCMPGMDGLTLQQALKREGCFSPVIFISGDGNIPASVTAVRQGALDFLEKPFAAEILLERVDEALAEHQRRRARAVEEERCRRQFGALTRREREVMRLAIEGLTNKMIARELGISPRTVENHRARVMEKMQASNIADLCQRAAACADLIGEPVV
jgi:two-component system response regulator FixJ